MTLAQSDKWWGPKEGSKLSTPGTSGSMCWTTVECYGAQREQKQAVL